MAEGAAAADKSAAAPFLPKEAADCLDRAGQQLLYLAYFVKPESGQDISKLDLTDCLDCVRSAVLCH